MTIHLDDCVEEERVAGGEERDKRHWEARAGIFYSSPGTNSRSPELRKFRSTIEKEMDLREIQYGSIAKPKMILETAKYIDKQ